MTHPVSPLRWGILSTGRIAGVFAQGLAATTSGRLVAVGSRSAESAARFAAAHGVESAHAHPTYESLLADPEVEAVYIATPHPQHVEWAVKAAEAGKHVLCEKPAALNHAEAMVMIQAARRAGVLFMEAFMYRCHPQTAKLAELLRSGVIGQVRLVQTAFGFRSDFNPDSRLWNNALGGGGILDVGCYAISLARLVAGAANGRPFADPVDVQGAGQLHPETGVDVVATASLRFTDGIVAQLSTAIGAQIDNTARIFGDEGWIEIPHPWIMTKSDGDEREIRVHRRGTSQPEIHLTSAGNLYALEANAVASAVRSGAREVPAMTPDDTLGNLRALDRWRAAIRLEYASEKAPATPDPLTLARRPLARRQPSEASAKAGIPFAKVAGYAKPVSRLIMGCDNQTSFPHACAMFDDYFERGGNAFDTAWLYAGGKQERLLGQWMRTRGVREQTVVLAKGGHTPFCTPRDIVRQLHESLDRLQTDHCDFYCLHRDNLDVPAAEFVDALAAEQRAGRIRGGFGGSNWNPARIDEANTHAKARGLPGFRLLSNQFSLARMVEAPWGGCLSAGDPDTRRWLAELAGTPDEVALFAWSSQARGFFTDRAAPDRTDDAELVRCWYAEDNWTRRAHLIELAKEKGVTPPAIAAAYVLAQPYPSFALIGPRTLAETDSSLECLRVTLTPSELAWLDLATDARP